MFNSVDIDKKYLNKVRKVFEPYYKRKLTDEELTEIINNLMGLYQTLKEIKEKYNGNKERGKK